MRLKTTFLKFFPIGLISLLLISCGKFYPIKNRLVEEEITTTEGAKTITYTSNDFFQIEIIKKKSILTIDSSKGITSDLPFTSYEIVNRQLKEKQPDLEVVEETYLYLDGISKWKKGQDTLKSLHEKHPNRIIISDTIINFDRIITSYIVVNEDSLKRIDTIPKSNGTGIYITTFPIMDNISHKRLFNRTDSVTVNSFKNIKVGFWKITENRTLYVVLKKENVSKLNFLSEEKQPGFILKGEIDSLGDVIINEISHPLNLIELADIKEKGVLDKLYKDSSPIQLKDVLLLGEKNNGLSFLRVDQQTKIYTDLRNPSNYEKGKGKEKDNSKSGRFRGEVDLFNIDFKTYNFYFETIDKNSYLYKSHGKSLNKQKAKKSEEKKWLTLIRIDDYQERKRFLNF